MSEWSDADLALGLKDKLDELITLYNTQRTILRDTSKCISQINNIKQIQSSTSTDNDGKTIITWRNPENASGGIMADDYRGEQITALIGNLEAYILKFD